MRAQCGAKQHRWCLASWPWAWCVTSVFCGFVSSAPVPGKGGQLLTKATMPQQMTPLLFCLALVSVTHAQFSLADDSSTRDEALLASAGRDPFDLLLEHVHREARAAGGPPLLVHSRRRRQLNEHASRQPRSSDGYLASAILHMRQTPSGRHATGVRGVIDKVCRFCNFAACVCVSDKLTGGAQVLDEPEHLLHRVENAVLVRVLRQLYRVLLNS